MNVRIVLEVARHELQGLARTRRALVLAALYLGAALIGSAVYVSIVQGIESAAFEVLIQQGNDLDEAAEMIDLAGQPAFDKVLEFFSGTPIDQMAPSLSESPVLPAFLWCSLAFLPLLVLLTSFDPLTSDIQQRSVCYELLRVSRAELVLGKLLAHFTAYAAAMVVSSLVLVGWASASLSTTPWSEALPGLARLWLLLLPFGAVYLGLTMLASVTARQPATALTLAFGLMVLLWGLGFFAHRDDPLRWLALASPAEHHAGLWQAGIAAPLTSSVAYLAIASASVALAIWQLGRRDL